MACLDTTQLTRPAESSRWHETSDNYACLALNFHPAEAKKGKKASLKDMHRRRRYLAFRYSHAGLMGARHTPNNNLDTAAVPRANRP